jgi:hypothetical protein
MSFSYKTLNSTDITLTSYIANKQWEANSSSLSQNGITIYVGENLPITRDNPFNPIDDHQTSNEEYRRLIFDSIKHLYYENYISASLTGQFFNSSSYFNYEQSTLTSGTIRNLTTITGSNLNPNEPALYDNPASRSLFDAAPVLYDLDILDPDEGSRIVVISIDKKIYGSGLSPKSVNISGSTYNIQDDGEGNLLDTLATSSLYVGNVFYSQGLIVITNQNYLCALGIPPTALNDYFSYNNTTPPSYLDILGNDYTDCGFIDYTSFISTGGNFPNYTQNNGLITITPDQTSVIPGNYQLGYTIASTTGIRSNTGSINLTITSQPLEIQVNTTDLTCWGTSSLVPVTCSINYGVPYYSWSFDGGASYTSSNSLTYTVVSGSVLSSANNTFHVKDYTGTIVSSSFTTWYPAIAPDVGYPYYDTPLCSSTASNGVIFIQRGTATQASVNGGAFTNLLKFEPTAFTNATTASTIIYKNAYGCSTSSIFNMDYLPQVTASFYTQSATCYGGSNGSMTFSWTNAVQNNDWVLEDNGDLLYSGLLDPTGTGITSGSITITNLSPTSSFSLYINGDCPGQNYYRAFTVDQPTQIIFSATASFIDSCSNAVIFNATGGTPPYTYFAAATSSGVTYSSDTNIVSLTNLSGSTYSLSVLDSNGCSSSSSLLTVFGRQYEYSGSVCSGSTGYVSSSAIQQNFISGPYSGSLVTSSYSNGTNLNGPVIDFKQLFISGTVDYILPCQDLSYYRILYNPILCPPGGCAIPILTTATPTDCNNFNGNYNVLYNSGSTNAIYTYIQYSTDPTFSSNITASIITNSSPLILPINVNNLPFPPSSYYTSVFFRAYNSCSSGFGTSSFSNILSADCIEPPSPTYEPFTVQIKNFSGITIKYINPITSNIISVVNNRSSSFNFSEETTSTQIAIQGVSGIQDPNPNGYYDYTINVSSSQAVDCNVATTVSPLLENSFFEPTTVNCGYIDGGSFAFFDSDGTASTYDAQVDIDRNTYTPGGTITLTIRPSSFEYNFEF